MSQLFIVTTPTNSGDGTPLATAFNYTNSNFSELYARYQVTPPSSLVGTPGDQPGWYASDASYFYYCFAAYDGSSVIWAQTTQVANIALPQITNGTSNISILGSGANATVSINGTNDVVVFAESGTYVNGIISATGNIQGDYILGDGSQLTGLPATYTDANVIVLLAALGSNTISTSGNVTVGNISSTGNVIGAKSGYFIGNASTGRNALYAGIPGYTPLATGVVAQFTGDSGSDLYTQINFQNTRDAGSADWVATADNGTDTTYYIDTGMTGSGHTDPAFFGDTSTVNNGYLYVVANNQAGPSSTTGAGNLIIGSTNGVIKLFVGNTAQANVVQTVSSTGISVTGNVTATSIVSASGNVRGGNVTTIGQMSSTGNITTAGYFLGNFIGNIVANISNIPGPAGAVVFNNGAGNAAATAGLVFNNSGPNVLTVLGSYSATGAVIATGNITGGNLSGTAIAGTLSTAAQPSITSVGTLTDLSVTNNISAGGNVVAVNNVSLGGNINAGGDASLVGNVTATAFTGTSMSASGTVTTASTVGGVITGTSVSVSGNITGASLTGTIATASQTTITSVGTLGTLSVTANIQGGNLRTTGNISATGNVRAGNISITGVEAGGNISASNYTGTSISVTGNVTGNYILGNVAFASGVPATYGNSNVATLLAAFGSNTISTTGAINSGNLFSTNISALGNIVGNSLSINGNVGISSGNVNLFGNINAAGNVLATDYLIASKLAYFSGNATTGESAIYAGPAGYNPVYPGIAAQFVTNTGTAIAPHAQINFQNIQANASTNWVATANNGTDTTYYIDMGIAGSAHVDSGFFNDVTNFNDGYLYVVANNQAGPSSTSGPGNLILGSTNGTIKMFVGNTAQANVIQTISSTGVSVAGNITGGNILGGANVNATTHTGTTVSVSGNVTASGLVGTVYTNSIINTGGNLTGNIGSSTKYFNTVFALATSAQYADLAEIYVADAEYTPETVVVFGGEKEITVTSELGDERVAGVVSTNPAYLMNSGESGVAVALRGKVPVKVVGPVVKGDSLVTSTTSGTAISVGRSREYGQAVFAKALETNDNPNEKVILAVIL